MFRHNYLSQRGLGIYFLYTNCFQKWNNVLPAILVKIKRGKWKYLNASLNFVNITPKYIHYLKQSETSLVQSLNQERSNVLHIFYSEVA